MAPLHTQGLWGGGMSREGIYFQSQSRMAGGGARGARGGSLFWLWACTQKNTTEGFRIKRRIVGSPCKYKDHVSGPKARLSPRDCICVWLAGIVLGPGTLV